MFITFLFRIELIDDLFASETVRDTFIDDIKECVCPKPYSNDEGEDIFFNVFLESQELVKTNPPAVGILNTLFYLEKIMMRCGFIDPKTNPIPSTDNDDFSKLYSVFDLMLVITFIYLGIIATKVKHPII